MLIFECLVIPHNSRYFFLSEDVMAIKSIKLISIL
jgi:hypothetical protein